MTRRFASMRDFYPFYLSQHENPVCRRLHLAGSALSLACLFAAGISRDPLWLLVGLVQGYAFAWVGHFAFERNRPATFRHPFYSFLGDWWMFYDVLRGRLRA